MAKLHLIETEKLPILQQLQIEEALLRTDDRLWCLINQGSPPAVVMGISGALDELELDRLRAQQIPIIRRFSGGGTVIVDNNTLFVTLLGPKTVLSPIPCFPEPLLRWTGSLYAEALGLPHFGPRENDFVLGEKKCAGNAQYFRKERWLHHTSFLWDYHPERMECLKLPRRTPPYRQGRNHGDFLTPLCHHLPSLDSLLVNLRATLHHHFEVVEVTLPELEPLLALPHRRSTQLLSY
jgi:lipoate---protein ligase